MDSRTLTPQTEAIATHDRASLDHDRPHVHLLRNEQMVTMLTAAGSGYVHLEGRALTRWCPDPTCDADGYFIYVRDLEDGKVWSTGFQPTTVEPVDYRASFLLGSGRYSRRDDGIVTQMDVCLAPDANVELRRVTITNQSTTARRIELTSYVEVVLHDPDADAAHPAFSKLFVETAQPQPGILVAQRRPRQANESTVAACHFLAGDDGEKPAEFETDRRRFLGRGRTVASPAALASEQSLSGCVGSVLDPVLCLRRTLYLPPNASAFVTFALGAGTCLAELLDAAERFAQPQSVDQALDAAEVTAQERSQQSGRSITAIRKSLQLGSSILYGLPPSQATSAAANGDGQDSPEDNQLHSAICQQFGLKPFSENGVVHRCSNAPTKAVSGRAARINRPANDSSQSTLSLDEQLQHDNGWGGFSADGTEYVIRLRPLKDGQLDRPPLPWVNVIANEKAGFIVSESGAGTTWSGNSRLNRLTPWHNDPMCDPPSEALYIRDDDAGVFWSPTPGPVSQATTYEVRHGFGYTRFKHTSNGLAQELWQFVPRDDAVKIVWVRMRNVSNQTRRLSLFSYHHWELGDGSQHASSNIETTIETTIDGQQSTVFATNDRRKEYAQHTAFAALIPPQDAGTIHSTCDRTEFLGRNGSMAAPRALTGNDFLSGRAGTGLDPCAASQVRVEIAPGETIEYAVLLGEAPTQTAAKDLLQRYRVPSQWASALDAIQQFWRDKLSAVQIETPSSAINLMVNGWLPYQNLSCRIWGRSSNYQSGGAYGYRDQLQDAAALVHQWPELTREQILRNAAHQFLEGDVMHWWHPPTSCGIRTTFSDDLLWLPLFAAEYVATTGDQTLWNEEARFLTAPPLPAGEVEVFLTPEDSGQRGTVYEHCCRALDRGLTSGRHGLPLMGSGDWNDGMNRVGQAGSGESVWLGFFIDYILERMLPVCEQFDDGDRIQKYSAYRKQLRTALNDAGWDGAWYRRAYFDDGTPLGTAASDECRIDALVQAWAVLSGVAPAGRAASALASVEKYLVDESAGLIRLLDPPFNKMKNDPGYIKGYVPGVRENGGQYTHGVLWFIRALAEQGAGTRATQLLQMLSPVSHGRSREEAAKYMAEPYVVAADVYGQPPHTGRAGWSWYTGSAGWMWRVAVESLLGIGLELGNTLTINPRIAADWPECRVRYRISGHQTVYEICIKNPDGKQQGVTAATLDGNATPVSVDGVRIPILRDSKVHQVVVQL